jgi:multidrug efflux pump subunit AcrA (membrane-fusion protein)
MSLQPDLPATSPEHAAPIAANGPVVQSAPGANPNGPGAPSVSRLPKAKRGSRAARFIIPAIILVLLVGGAGAGYFFFRGPSVRADLIKVPVERIKVLQFKVVERGFLEAKNNNNIICDVKTGNRGAPKIKSVVDNGTAVKKGELLMEIDDSYLQDQLIDQEIARDKAEQDMITAEKAYPALQAAIEVAEKNLTKWNEGDFSQQKHDLEGKIQTAESNLLQQEDRTSWAARMVKKTYMTASQLEAEQANLSGDKLQVDQYKEQLAVLINYTDKVQKKTLETALATARDAERAGFKNMETMRLVFKQQKAKYEDLQTQIKQCKIISPSSGILVYYVPETTRGGFGTNQSIIAVGEPVQYGQKMMSIPDLTHMQVNVRIHEAFIGHMNVKPRVIEVTPESPAAKAGLRPGDIITRFGDTDVEFLPDLNDAVRSYHEEEHKPNDVVPLKVLRDKKEVALELTLGNHSPAKTDGSAVAHTGDPARHFGARFMPGLKADVRVDAAPGKVLKGHVSMVSAAAAQQDWMSPDVKVYQATVEIDDSVKGLKLKPGLSAVCTIYTETVAENVVGCPVQAILPAAERGGDPRVVVATAKGTETRTVKLLKIDDKLITDDKYVGIEEGLKEGDEVVLNPKAVLGDKDKDNKKPGQDAGKGGPPDMMKTDSGGRGGNPKGPPNGSPGGPR